MNHKENSYKKKSRKYFDRQAANYAKTWDGRYCSSMYEGVMEKIRQHPFMSVLDVGCGTGTMLALLVKEYPDIQACGIDLSEKMVAQAASLLGSNVQSLVGDADNMSLPDNSFDLLTCNASFHHYPHPLKVLAEMQRILKPNGRLVIADPWWSKNKRLVINYYLNSPFNFGGDVRIYSKQEMHQLLSESGFHSIEWELVAKTYSIVTAVAGK
jgi:ubiquinone/menaquinone biosynthesis C-methylase UbiE